MLSKTLLIDGDIILFKLAFRHQYRVFGELKTDSLAETQVDLDLFLNNVIESSGCLDYIVCLSSWQNFRKDLWSQYKLQRKAQEKPKHLAKLRAYLQANYETLTMPKLEADDVIGILASQDYDNYIIASTDKDLMQIPGLHYDWRNDEFFKVTPEEGLKFFYQQVLSGDPADGYKGCPGIGKIKAKRIIEAVEDGNYWEAVLDTYEANGLSYDDALLNARLAFILDKDHWDESNEEVILWTPPTEEETLGS